MSKENNGEGFAVSSMVLGIVSVSLGVIIGWFLPFIFVITSGTGLGLAIAAQQQSGDWNGKSITGLVTNILALTASLAWCVVLGAALMIGV